MTHHDHEAALIAVVVLVYAIYAFWPLLTLYVSLAAPDDTGRRYWFL